MNGYYERIRTLRCSLLQTRVTKYYSGVTTRNSRMTMRHIIGQTVLRHFRTAGAALRTKQLPQRAPN